MKMLKKIYILLIAIVSCSMLFNITITASDKSTIPVSTDAPFSTKSIIVSMQHDVSMKIKNYTPYDFKEVSPSRVIDINPYAYQTLVDYLLGKEVDLSKFDMDNFRREFTLEWDKDFSKEEIIEMINVLLERDDIYSVQPNYLYTLQSSDLYATSDYVSPDVWTNYYYLSVISKDKTNYVDSRGNKQFVVEAKLIKSYNNVVGINNKYDEILNKTLSDSIFEFCVSEELFDIFNTGYEYIVQLDHYKEVHLENNKKTILSITENTDSAEFFRVINGRIYFKNVKTHGNNKEFYSYFYYNKLYFASFNQFIFKKEFVKNELPFEFEVKYNKSLAGDFISIIISDEEREKMIPNFPYVYYYYKCGVFLFSGDDVLMFDEYIKLAKQVSITGELFELEAVKELRENAYYNIAKSNNNI